MDNREPEDMGEVEGTVLRASHVYLLMSKEYRISRNRRAEWFFTHLNSTVSFTQKYKLEEYTEELEIVSIIPKDPPHTWSIEASHVFRYLVCSDTIVEILSRKYRFVYCLDISPSAGSVDVQTGIVTIDGMFGALQHSMEGLVKPFYVPGSYFMFQPKIYVTVLAHAPFLSSFVDEAVVQGVLLDSTTCKHVLQMIFRKLEEVENRVAKLTSIVNEAIANAPKVPPNPAGNRKSDDSVVLKTSLAMSPDFGFVDLLRHALIALHLLPENSASGLIVLTDGVISVPDGGYLDMALSQLRFNTVSCSFIQLTSPFHPHASHGTLPYSDFMRFISTATFGAFLTFTNLPRIETDSKAMNTYHKSFLTWSFQDSVESFKNSLFATFGNKPGEWSVQNKCFSTIRDMPIVKKQQYETTMNVDYSKVLSCRLREGFTIREAHVGKDSMLHIKLVLPWKFLIVIEYMLITPWPAPVHQSKVTSIISLEAPYDFLHDVTCLAKKPFQSYYRQLLVNKFWASQKHLSESDKLLAHFNSFASNSHYYTIPERLKNGVPLFYISANSSALSFQSSENAFPHFSQFWKPVCLLDTDIWQKWMHTHRIGVILEHDHPIPKYIHQPNPSGRFHVIQCRQTMMGLNTLLMDWSSFVLVENHSYIKLMFREKDKPPSYFCMIRVTTKPPCVILRLAFLVGTPGELRHRDITELRHKIAALNFPQRLNEPPKWRVPSGSSFLANPSRNYKRTWSDMPCCVILYKPIEKILIRYEQIPDFTKSLLPQDPYNNWTLNASRKTTSNQSTFGFRPTYSTPLGSHAKMGPEMFNIVARYLHHQRWIWSVQGTTTHPLHMYDCVVRILSTITKMRLQEGLRFAYTSCGIVNMMMELELQNERLGISEPDIENIEDYERTTSVLQYLMFPPVTSLVSNVDEDEEEREDEIVEPHEEVSNLYLITECWIEPQVGRILTSSTESTSFNGLEYDQVPTKIFDMDQECISALITFEHLSFMCQNEEVPSPSEVIDRGIDKSRLDETERNIHYIPFKCELKRILPKCQQAELLFSMFNQDLSKSFPVSVHSDISNLCDRANSILFESWISNVAQAHQREVILHPEEHETLYELITRRVRPLEQGERPFPRTVPEASYHDLKILMLCAETLEKTNSNKSVFLLPTDEPNDSSYINDPSCVTSPAGTPQPSRPAENETVDDENELDDRLELKLYEHSSQSKGHPPSTSSPPPPPPTIGVRKRSRVKSGGESGPASKKPLNRKTSLDNLFRCRTNSVEAAWKAKAAGNKLNKDSDDCRCILSPTTESEKQDSQLSFGSQVGGGAGQQSSATDKLFSPNHQAKYGSITLPIYVYNCSLSTLSEHVIFRTNSGGEDIYTDCRVCSIVGDEDSYPTKSTTESSPKREPLLEHISPEPKSEEQDLPATNGDTLENHCRALEVAFAKSYVHGLFESFQAGNYVHSNDVQEAVRLCRETKIEINLSEFIQTICRHFKEIRRRNKSEEVSNDDEPSPSCDELKDIHGFIKKRFNQSILSAFHWVMDCAGIFYFKNSDELKLNEVQSRSNSSKNLTDAEESGTVKADSMISELRTGDITINSVEPSELEQEYSILGPDFFTLDESTEVLSEENGPVPLFLYLACTYIHGDFSGSFLVYDIPTCLEEIADLLGDNFESGDPEEKTELFLDFVFLTVPTEVEEVDYRVAGNIRTSSMCSLSPVPMGRKGELNLIPFSKEREISLSGMFDQTGKAYPILPSQQYYQVKSVVDDVKWLLKDEVTSFRWESSPMTELALMLVACHVEKSAGKPGCQVNLVPLNFVNNSAQIGYEKFKERFRKSTIEGYELKEEGSLFYLVPLPKPERTLNFQSSCDNGRSYGSQAQAGEEQLAGEMYRLSLEGENSTNRRVEYELEDPELLEISVLREQQQKRYRKSSGQDSGRRVNPTGGSTNEGPFPLQDGGSGEQQSKRDLQERCNYLPTPSQLSEFSSIIESTNTYEDGYEGDGSESGEDIAIKLESEIRNRNLPPFWVICKLSQQQVVIYFHCRYDEENIALYEYLLTLRNKMLSLVRRLKRTVNQDILLQQLHDTRQCSPLIEAKTQSSEYVENGLHYPPPIVNKRIEDFEGEGDTDPKQFPAGYFSCDVVWETKFVLHSRLRTGPGKSLVSRGIQTLKATLIAFEVGNRQNMFVYQDRSGNVFYLRLYRMEDKSMMDLTSREIEDIEGAMMVEDRKEGRNENEFGEFTLVNRQPQKSSTTPQPENNESVILLRVHGITEAGEEIKDNLVQSLRNKLDDAVMDILSVTLDRNPHCKLTPEDVTFIQKVNAPPDTILRNGINAFAFQHLPAFAYFLHQNLLQFFHLPKYTELKADYHFRDFAESYADGAQVGTMYLYNQRPGGTGSRGIAAVAVSIVDINGKSFSTAEWSRPVPDAFLETFRLEDFDERVMTEEVEKSSPSSSSVFVELRMWKQGRINLDLLKGFLNSAIQHSIWDLTTEFYFLTAPLSDGIGPGSSAGDNAQFSFSFSAPSTPKSSGLAPPSGGLMQRKLHTLGVPTPVRVVEGRRNSIVTAQTAKLDTNLEVPDTRLRSLSVNARVGSGHDGKMTQGRASSPMAFPFPGLTMSKGRQQLDPLIVGLNRLEAGDAGHLHCHYEKLLPAWCEFGFNLSVPSVRIVTIDLAVRHPIDTLVVETEKLVQQIVPDYEAKQFWKLENSGESGTEFLAGERVLTDLRSLQRKNMEAELKVLKSNFRRLENQERRPVLSNYPVDLISLFKSPEEFQPTAQGDECILISRNIIHWKFCVGSIDSQFFTLESYKSQYKFPPLISSAWDQTPVGSYVSLEKLPRPTSATGLSCLLNEPENNVNPILIPRQRLLLSRITNSKISFIFYNWSKESMDRLIDSTKLLASWLNARSCLLSSIHAQKSALFYNQPITRGPPIGNNETNAFTCGGAEVESLLRFPNPPKEFPTTRLMNLKKPKSLKNLTPFLECFRNLKHQSTVFKVPSVNLDPFRVADEQMNQIRCSEKAELKSTIFQYWLSRGPSASNVIGADGIQAFKQAARTLHYCFTPIIFLPRWRNEIASTRDNSIGIVKKSRALSDPNPKPLGFHLKSDLAGLRSRHDSGTSQKSLDSIPTPTNNPKGRSKSIWGLWQTSSSQLSQDSQASSSGNPSLTNLSIGGGTGRKSDEKWHSALCDSFIQEYMQYLQTLGFIPIQGRNSAAKKLAQGKSEVMEPERLRHISGSSMLYSSSSQSGHSMGVTFNNFSRRVREDSGNGDDKVFYLQKSLPGGIMLFEVGLSEPFFYSKIHSLEVTRIQTRKSRKGSAYQNILDFVSQCEKMKVLMHLHSFTYDFHLRSIHSYILGRQLLFKQGYHITNFLDDFVKYYPKGPNFARNTVHIGTMTIQNVTTPATILFNYMLEKLYNMKVIRMNVDRNYENNHCVQQYILVDMSSKKIVYRDMDDERQCDEFDLTLLLAHDSPPYVLPYSVDPSVLRLKYYIILTSRRELYPKVSEEIGDGKLCLVNTPEVLNLQKEFKTASGSGLSDSKMAQKRRSYAADGNQGEQGIREESVHYMSFFSSHEQTMHQIVSEQVDWVEERIRGLVSTASVDCRRDLLWQRLVLANNERQKNQKEDLISRETVGALTYWEFGELLELVHVKPLSEMDPRGGASLACLLRQPVSFYQSLLKMITQGGTHNFRYFASHDKSTHHLAIFSPNADNVSPKITKHIVMMDINFEKRTSDLSVLFKDNQDANKTPELEPEMLNLIESVVNTVCYSWWWWWSTVCPS